ASAQSRLLATCAVAVMVMLAEFVGGYVADSLAIMSDAAHMGTDVLGLVVSLVAVRLATMPFGYKRAEVVGALASIVFLWVVTGCLVYSAVRRMHHVLATPDAMDNEAVDGKLMFVVAAIALTANVAMLFILGHEHHGHSHGGHGHGDAKHGHCHGGAGHCHGDGDHGRSHCHSHARWDHGRHSATIEHHKHGTTSSDVKDLPNELGTPQVQYQACADAPDHDGVDNLNLRAAYIHILGDFLQNIGVLVAGAVIWWRPSWHVVDPILTCVFGGIVACTTFGILRTSISIIMEASPSHMDPNEVDAFLHSLQPVQSTHDLRVWSIGSSTYALCVHVVVRAPVAGNVPGDGGAVVAAISRDLQRRYHGLDFTTIQVEDEACACISGTLCAEDARGAV
ncbi:hypothetical protein DYB32_006550, partial [Aphanomyces invadans]